MNESIEFFNYITEDKLVKPISPVNNLEVELDNLCSTNLNKLKIGFLNCGKKFENIIKYLKSYTKPNFNFFPDIICLVDVDPDDFELYKKSKESKVNSSNIYEDIICGKKISYKCYQTFDGDREKRYILINRYSINKKYSFNNLLDNYNAEIIVNNCKLKFIHAHNPNDRGFNNKENDIKTKCLNKIDEFITGADIIFGDFNQDLLLENNDSSDIETKYVKEFITNIKNKGYEFKRISSNNKFRFDNIIKSPVNKAFTFIQRDRHDNHILNSINIKELDYIITNNKLNISNIFFDGAGINPTKNAKEGSDHCYLQFTVDLN